MTKQKQSNSINRFFNLAKINLKDGIIHFGKGVVLLLIGLSQALIFIIAYIFLTIKELFQNDKRRSSK